MILVIYHNNLISANDCNKFYILYVNVIFFLSSLKYISVSLRSAQFKDNSLLERLNESTVLLHAIPLILFSEAALAQVDRIMRFRWHRVTWIHFNGNIQ